MTSITVPAGHSEFSGRYASLRTQLIELVAERDGLPIHGAFRPDFYQAQAQSRADDLISAWERSPHPPVDEIERTLAAMAANVIALRRHREKLAAERAKHLPTPAEPEPTLIRLQVRDELTGRAVQLEIPKAMIVGFTA